MGQGAGWGRDADKVHLDGHWHDWVKVWAAPTESTVDHWTEPGSRLG